jgi:hypothetical protein
MLHVSPFVNYLSGKNPRCEDEKPLPPRPSNLVPSSVPRIVSSNPGPNPKPYVLMNTLKDEDREINDCTFYESIL